MPTLKKTVSAPRGARKNATATDEYQYIHAACRVALEDIAGRARGVADAVATVEGHSDPAFAAEATDHLKELKGKVIEIEELAGRLRLMHRHLTPNAYEQLTMLEGDRA